MVTIKDISKACGVSLATVSKALNGYGDIGEETKQKVLKAAEALNYIPNAAARQLKANTSYNIGVLFSDETACGLTHEFFSHILNSAKVEMERLGYDITFISQDVGGRKSSFLEHARYRKVDGVLIASVDFKSPAVIELAESDIPTVTIDYVYNDRSSVLSDNVEGEYALTKYLIECGHRKIAFVHGEATSVTEKRLIGFHRAVSEAGLTVPEEYLLESRYHDTQACEKATEKLLSLKHPPTAILYPDDFSFIGAMAALTKRGMSIPEDISVAGYDGIMLSQLRYPRLTTYRQDTEEIGKKAAAKLVEIINHPKTAAPAQIMVRGELLPGDTVKKLA